MKSPRKTGTAPKTIEHNAEEPMRTEGGETLAKNLPGANAEGEVVMPGVENDLPYAFEPKRGCSILDTYEILLMYLIHLTNSSVQFAPGALRGIPLPPERVAQLSAQAQLQMRQVTPSEVGITQGE